MTETRKYARCGFAVLLVCWSLVAPVAATTQENSMQEDSTPETADEYLDAFRGLQGHEAFQEYSEFEVVRSQAISTVQVGTFTEAKAERMALVYEVLVTFEEAYNLSQTGSRVESLERANATATLLADLRAAGGNQYAALTTLALDRFYRDQGEALHEEALAANDTRTKLELMRHAATAYKHGGAVEKYSNLVVQRGSLESSYEADVETLNESMAAARRSLSRCDDGCESPVAALATHSTSVFDRYADMRRTTDRLAVAADVAAEHGLSDRADEVSATRERAWSAVVSLAVASAALVLGFAAVVAIVAMVVAHRLSAWARDVEHSHVGEIVMSEEVVHG